MKDVSEIRAHMEVVGSDGQHVGTVDCIENDVVKLAKNDPESGGQHHTIPLEWVESIDGNEVRLNKLSDEAQAEWAETSSCDSASATA
jgi:hypothetical protein